MPSLVRLALVLVTVTLASRPAGADAVIVFEAVTKMRTTGKTTSDSNIKNRRITLAE